MAKKTTTKDSDSAEPKKTVKKADAVTDKAQSYSTEDARADSKESVNSDTQDTPVVNSSTITPRREAAVIPPGGSSMTLGGVESRVVPPYNRD